MTATLEGVSEALQSLISATRVLNEVCRLHQEELEEQHARIRFLEEMLEGKKA
jgi:hypothetical protein